MLGAKPSSRAAAATLSLVSARSLPWPFRALEAVPIETPAMAATSRMVTRRRLGSCGDKPLLRRSVPRHRAGPPKRWAMTGLDAMSRASYLTKENLFLSQSGPCRSPAAPARDPRLHARAACQAAPGRAAWQGAHRQAPLDGTTRLHGTIPKQHQYGASTANGGSELPPRAGHPPGTPEQATTKPEHAARPLATPAPGAGPAPRPCL